MLNTLRTQRKGTVHTLLLASALAVGGALCWSTPAALADNDAAVELENASSGIVYLSPGATYDLGLDSDYRDTVTCKSSKPSVAKVSASGKVTAKKRGKAIITVTEKSPTGSTAKATCKVKVVAKSRILNVYDIKLRKVPSKVKAGQTVKLSTPKNVSVRTDFGWLKGTDKIKRRGKTYYANTNCEFNNKLGGLAWKGATTFAGAYATTTTLRAMHVETWKLAKKKFKVTGKISYPVRHNYKVEVLNTSRMGQSAYTGYPVLVYLKTDNPSKSTFDLKSQKGQARLDINDDMLNKGFVDIRSADPDELIWSGHHNGTPRRVAGGYLLCVVPTTAGHHKIAVREEYTDVYDDTHYQSTGTYIEFNAIDSGKDEIAEAKRVLALTYADGQDAYEHLAAAATWIRRNWTYHYHVNGIGMDDLDRPQVGMHIARAYTLPYWHGIAGTSARGVGDCITSNHFLGLCAEALGLKSELVHAGLSNNHHWLEVTMPDGSKCIYDATPNSSMPATMDANDPEFYLL